MKSHQRSNVLHGQYIQARRSKQLKFSRSFDPATALIGHEIYEYQNPDFVKV